MSLGRPPTFSCAFVSPGTLQICRQEGRSFGVRVTSTSAPQPRTKRENKDTKKKRRAHFTCHSEACLPSARWRRWRCLVSSRRGNFNDAMPGDQGRPLLTFCVSNFVPSERRADKPLRMETALQRRRLSPSVPGRNAREKPYGRSAKAS